MSRAVEYAASRIEGAQLIPAVQLQANLRHLPKDQPIVVLLPVGGRSCMAVGMLRLQGYDARNLSGGIKAWKARIEK
jgi:rhodanese-related sulfurtransferase